MLNKKDLSALQGMFEKNNAEIKKEIQATKAELKAEIRANTGELIELISSGFEASAK